MTKTTITLTHLTFDCGDAEKVAGFWSQVLGRPVKDGSSPEFAVIDGAPGWMFLQVPEGKTAKNRMHVDFVARGDLDEEVERLVGLGATRGEKHHMEAESITWVCLTDPEGNEFDVAAE
jgi:catechol-2,3-dioxygenase